MGIVDIYGNVVIVGFTVLWVFMELWVFLVLNWYCLLYGNVKGVYLCVS